jgi:DNA invertase Pin-like site-specific DNA recombinase
MPHINEDRHNIIRALLLKGLSLKTIAERCHVSHTTVSNVRAECYPSLFHILEPVDQEHYRAETDINLFQVTWPPWHLILAGQM